MLLRRGKRDGAVEAGDADDRAVEIAEGFFVDDGGDFSCEASSTGVLVEDDDFIRLLYRGAMASRSSGETVRRSRISKSIFSFARISAASRAECTMAA